MRTTFKTLAAGFVIAIATAGMAAPAAAGGSLSITVLPGNAKDAKAMRTALQLYSLHNGLNSGGIAQRGNGNPAGLGQNGRGNLGVIHQQGYGHQGTLQQNGNGNSYGLFQFGRNTSANVVQYGGGRTGATFQFGW